MRFSSVNEWLAWQETLNPAEIELGLDRVAVVLRRMRLADPAYTIITIAGTNGKGSSGAMLRSIYTAAGYQVGLYSSPHLQRYNERITLNGIEVDDATLCRAFDRVEQARTDGDEIPLTYFEFGTLAAIAIFAEKKVDIAILEVGLGGRLDAVNAVDPDVALVTMVDVDHEAWLGSDRETIAREKAGIYRSGVPAICADPDPASSLLDHAAEIGASCYLLKEQFSFASSGNRWSWQSDGQSYQALPLPALPGEFQLRNAAGVLMAVELLQNRFPVERTAIETGLQQAQLAGRMERIKLDDRWVECLLDVAHNPSSAAVLAELLAAEQCSGRTHGVIGMLADKDIATVVTRVAPVIDRWYVASLDGAAGSRGCVAETVVSHLPQQVVASFADVAAACRGALAESRAGDRVVVFGSFYTVGEAKTFFDHGCCSGN